MKNENSNKDITIKGKLSDYYETGMEGIGWIIEPEVDDVEFHSIEEGDYLFVFDKFNNIVWQDDIIYDCYACWETLDFNPMYGRQSIGGVYIYWLPYNCDPQTWANYFFENNSAILVKKEKKDAAFIEKMKKECFERFESNKEKDFHNSILKSNIECSLLRGEKIISQRKKLLFDFLRLADPRYRIYGDYFYILVSPDDTVAVIENKHIIPIKEFKKELFIELDSFSTLSNEVFNTSAESLNKMLCSMLLGLPWVKYKDNNYVCAKIKNFFPERK